MTNTWIVRTQQNRLGVHLFALIQRAQMEMEMEMTCEFFVIYFLSENCSFVHYTERSFNFSNAGVNRLY